MWDADNERDERKKRFVEIVKRKKAGELLGPLSEKMRAYERGEIGPDEVFKATGYAAKKGDALMTDFKKKPDVILAGIAMDENRYLTAIGEIGISVRCAAVTDVFADAIVNPVRSDGSMYHEAGASILEKGGAGIGGEIASRAPIPPGTAAVTGPGELPVAAIIHASIAEPSKKCSLEKVRAAVSAALSLAEKSGHETLALPGTGCGRGGLSPEQSAAVVVEAIKAHEAENVTKIILADTDEAVIGAFVGALERMDEEDQ